MSDRAVYDIVIIGGSAGGLSVAISSLRSGLSRIRVLESDSRVALPDLIGPNNLDVGFGENVQSVDVDGDLLVVTTERLSYRTRAVLVADRHTDPTWTPPIEVPDSDRVHVGDVDAGSDQDILVVGLSDHAVELTAQYVDAGNRVVLAANGMDPTLLSPAGASVLNKLERDRLATLLYRSTPRHITFVGEYPMAEFGDRRTPDLQFDHIVFAAPRAPFQPSDVGVTDAALASGAVWFIGDEGEHSAPGWQVGVKIAEACFPELDVAADVLQHAHAPEVEADAVQRQSSSR